MSKGKGNLRSISRRDTLKICLVPAGAFATRWLPGCTSNKANPNLGANVATPDTTATASGGASGSANASVAGTSALGSGGTNATATPAAGTAGAGTSGSTTPMTANAGTTASAGVGGSSMSAGAGGSAATGNSGVAGPGVAWATGGTKSMLGGYPDPFATAPGTACKVYPSQTLGPCYAQMPMMREDLSDGLGGLPVRLSLMVVRANGCMPVPNATVDIWHAGSGGFYSAYAMGTICNPGSENVQTKTFGRGVQTTDANGKVNFSTVFPGWYNGRSIHIHFTLRVNGQEYVTSQLYFEDKLDDEILAQGDYKARGTRDTTNATDMTFLSGGANADEVLLSTAKRPDGVLHAWKVLSIG